MKFPLKQFAALLAFSCLATFTAQADDWPQWRGPDRTDISKETGLLKSWPEGGPKRVWLYENAGNGYSGPAIAKGKYYTMGTRDGSESLIVLDANTGKELWVTKIGSVLENNWGGGPRGTPAVDGDRVYALTGPGILACINTADGKIVWQQSLVELGGKVPGWGYTESVLVDGDLVLCTPGGSKGSVAALDKKTGKLVWQSTGYTDEAQYASIVPATINGIPQYIQLTMKSVVGLSTKDGKVVWQSPWPGRTAVIPTPIYRDNHVYITTGYGVGCKLVKIAPDNTVSDVYENKVMKNHHGGVILVGDHVYGYSDGPGWICQKYLTGEEVWANKELGKGAIAYADGKFYCLDEGSGTVVLIDASPTGWKESGRFKLDPQTKIRNPQGRVWTHPVISNGKLYLRDQDLVYCYDIKAQ